MTVPCCFDCQYFVPIRRDRHGNPKRNQVTDPIQGSCRCNAPTPGSVGDDDKLLREACWPMVIATDWCGKHMHGPLRRPMRGTIN